MNTANNVLELESELNLQNKLKFSESNFDSEFNVYKFYVVLETGRPGPFCGFVGNLYLEAVLGST